MPFDIFSEKLGNYIIREVTNASDLVCVVRDMKYPIKYFENNQNLNSMSVDDRKDPINVAIQQQFVNNYVNRDSGLRRNHENIYGIV